MKLLWTVLIISVSVVVMASARSARRKNPEEGDLFEGDIDGIVITIYFLSHKSFFLIVFYLCIRKPRNPKGAFQIPTRRAQLWSGGIVPYMIDPAAEYCKKFKSN